MTLLHTGPFGTNSLLVPLGTAPGGVPTVPGKAPCRKVFIVDPACCDFSRDRELIYRRLQEQELEPVAVVLTQERQ